MFAKKIVSNLIHVLLLAAGLSAAPVHAAALAAATGEPQPSEAILRADRQEAGAGVESQFGLSEAERSFAALDDRHDDAPSDRAGLKVVPATLPILLRRTRERPAAPAVPPHAGGATPPTSSIGVKVPTSTTPEAVYIACHRPLPRRAPPRV